VFATLNGEGNALKVSAADGTAVHCSRPQGRTLSDLAARRLARQVA
jgi:hypothetical protein